MPAPTMHKCGPPLTIAKIKALEERIGGTLPKAYRDFLLRWNGGRPTPSTFCKKGKPFSSLNMFFGLGIKDRFWDLRTQYREARNEMPKEVLPIGLEVFGDVLCLAFKGKYRGKVYLWNHEGAPETVDPRIEFPWLELDDDYEFKGDDWPGHPDLTWIADRFEELWNSFVDDE